MSNPHNLIPNSERTPRELKEMTTKGGIASGATRRMKRNLKETIQAILSMPISEEEVYVFTEYDGEICFNDLNDMNLTVLGTICHKLVSMAMKGDIKAMELALEIAGMVPKKCVSAQEYHNNVVFIIHTEKEMLDGDNNGSIDGNEIQGGIDVGVK